ncbi:MAG TPA: peptide chain release factor 1 [Candidatus Polarisedimenticolia bacterium]|nr:peptide chain release factor 1 [Candidatus Polarisedimenticolia bacterium]
MLEKLEALERRYEELGRLIADPAVLADPPAYRTHVRAFSDLEEIVSVFRDYRRALKELEEAREMVRAGAGGDASLLEMARDEQASLDRRRSELEARLKVLLVPKDPNDDKSVILEVRAGTGGDEAALFAAEIFRMYARYAEKRGWRVEVLDMSRSEAGGLKEVIAAVEGKGAYSRLKYESGVHRVQRVPVTESAGRIHTSAVTVAVLPEAEEVEVKVDDKDIRIDRFCSSGPGGQSVNTTYSAVRLTHIPTGLVVSCQDEKSQHKNLAKAMRVLRSRLYDIARQEQDKERAATRREMVGTGDRSEKIRTYNFPQGRVSDHRIKLTLHQVQDFMEGEMDEMLEALATHYQAERLKEEIKV